MTKVLGISHYYLTDNRAGGEMMFHEILKWLVKEGYKVDAIATKNTGEPTELDGVKVYRGKEYRDIDIKKYDLIVGQFNEATLFADRIKKAKIPFVYIVHNDSCETRALLKDFCPDLTIFNTHWLKAHIGHTGNSIVVHPPVYSQDHATTRGECITLVNVMPAKGSNMFYNMAIRQKRFPFLAVQGGYMQEYQQTLRRPNIMFIDNTDNMKRDVWNRTKILLMPSTYESYGMVAVEALASGIPVIANSLPGLRESLSYGGIFPRNNNIREWSKEIHKLMTDPNYYRQRSELALQRSAEIDPTVELKELSKKIKELL